ncbi:Chloroplast sensor kinase [Vigna angularis]|uniref:Chloroplast sensor kinase n=1 Tax=Phaseolus angularis TaxID=3914 RepID=A0A8T0JE86_PHAAN|nr:Chloroplast sensor kinase [Vigna angularis]
MLICAASAGVTHTPPHSSLSFCSSNAKSHRIFSNSVSLPITHNDNPTSDSDDALHLIVPSATAVASAIRKASTSPVQFTQTLQTNRQTELVLPSTDFHRLCLHQLHLFCLHIVHKDSAVLPLIKSNFLPSGNYLFECYTIYGCSIHQYQGNGCKSASDDISINEVSGLSNGTTIVEPWGILM